MRTVRRKREPPVVHSVEGSGGVSGPIMADVCSDGDGKGADLRIKGSVLLISGGIGRWVGIRELGRSRTVPLVFNNEFKLPALRSCCS